MEKKKYRAAVIGCGRIGCGFDDDPKRKIISTHAGAYFKNEEIELVSLADTDTDKLEKYSKKFKVPKTYTDYKKMLATERPDILSICTWNSSHHEIVKDAVNNGVKFIFCEKPISNTIDNAKRMIRICNDNNVHLMIDHQRRFDPTHQGIKKYLEEGKLGRIQQINFYYTAGIANTGSHMFDLLRFFFGDVEWIQAFESENKSPKPKDPNFDGIMKFKNGIFCTIQALDVNNYTVFDLYIFGTKGIIKIINSGLTAAKYYTVVESKLEKGRKELIEAESPIKEYPRDFMLHAIEHALYCLKNNTKPLCSGEDGLASLELICAFHESVKEGCKRIFLPLKESKITIESK